MRGKMTLTSIESSQQQQSIINISLLIKLVEKYGANPWLLLGIAQIDSDCLVDPKATISIQQEVRFVRAMLKAIDKPNLGFHIVQGYRLSAFGNLGMAAVACETIEDAVQLFLKYVSLSYTHFDISFFKIDDNAVLRFKDRYAYAGLRQFYIERDFSFLLVSIRDMFAQSIEEQKFKVIHFDFKCPTKKEIFEELFECEVKFSMPFNEIQFDGKFLDRALPQDNLLTKQLMEEQCENQQIEILGTITFAEEIRLIIASCENDMPNMEEIAAKFNITTRTFRRKLKVENLTFQQIVNQELTQKAIHYLETTSLTVEQIAYRLGYGESSSFIHAFKRWTGQVPKVYRR